MLIMTIAKCKIESASSFVLLTPLQSDPYKTINTRELIFVAKNLYFCGYLPRSVIRKSVIIISHLFIDMPLVCFNVFDVCHF